MNKKKLSAVMAGAMLASSVSPVLAATESELDTSRLGSLVEKVHAKLTEKVFSEVVENASTKDGDLVNKSVYYVKINDKDAAFKNSTGQTVVIKDMVIKTDEDKEELRKALQEVFKNLTAGDKVEIYSHGFREKDNKVYAETEAVVPKYELKTEADNLALKAEIEKIFTELNLKNNPLQNNLNGAQNASFDTTTPGQLKIRFAMNLNLVNAEMPGYTIEDTFVQDAKGDTLVIKGGDDKLDFTKYIDASSKPVSFTKNDQSLNRSDIKGFPKAEAKADEIKDTLEETIKITGIQHNYKTTDLYDGLMLTTEGHKILSLVKEVRRDKDTDTKATIKNLYGYTYNEKVDINDLKADKNGEFGFVLVVKDAFNKTTEYTVKGAEKQTEVLASWLNNELAKVDILAGDNRYETAVEIAKEQARVASPEYSANNSKVIKNIVLVNGHSLVDGLSAAPLAAKLTAGGDFTSMAAPVLLTEADELPKATKEYLVELMTNQTIGNPAKATIHLVGGTTVLTRSLEKELKALGFEVERYGVDNREETSLKVAKEIDEDLTNGAFIVGADGEADAMSISGYASMKKMPVIVAKKGGISYDALDAIEGETVTVIGGEASISAEDYEAIKEEAKAVRRISGSDRQATNAAIIKEFYHEGATTNGVVNQESVIVAKDGKGNKTELVDALTAANLAAQTNAPVVLAKSSLTDDQIDAIRLRAKSSDSLYQVGIGVERPVVETIASKLGLLNK